MVITASGNLEAGADGGPAEERAGHYLNTVNRTGRPDSGGDLLFGREPILSCPPMRLANQAVEAQPGGALAVAVKALLAFSPLCGLYFALGQAHQPHQPHRGRMAELDFQ